MSEQSKSKESLKTQELPKPPKSITEVYIQKKLTARRSSTSPHRALQEVATISKEDILNKITSNEQALSLGFLYGLTQSARHAETAQQAPNTEIIKEYDRETIKLTDEITELAA